MSGCPGNRQLIAFDFLVWIRLFFYIGLVWTSWLTQLIQILMTTTSIIAQLTNLIVCIMMLNNNRLIVHLRIKWYMLRIHCWLLLLWIGFFNKLLIMHMVYLLWRRSFSRRITFDLLLLINYQIVVLWSIYLQI